MGSIARDIRVSSRLVHASEALTIDVFTDGSRRVVHVGGELDLATSDSLFIAAAAGGHPSVVIDLTELTFMDCGGYRCLVACRRAIGRRGGTLAVRGQTGEPARLMNLIRALEAR